MSHASQDPVKPNSRCALFRTYNCCKYFDYSPPFQEGPRQTAVDVLTLTPKETSPAFPPAAKPDIWISTNTDRGGDFSKKRRASDPVQSSCRFATFKIIYYSSYDNYLHYFQVYQDHLGDPRLYPFCLRILRKLIPCGGGCLWPRFSMNAI